MLRLLMRFVAYWFAVLLAVAVYVLAMRFHWISFQSPKVKCSLCRKKFPLKDGHHYAVDVWFCSPDCIEVFERLWVK